MATIGEVVSADTKMMRVVDGIRANAHSKVLVVGCRGDNFPAEWRVHPQLEFWDGDAATSRAVPEAVKMVLVTRFVPHSGYTRLRDECIRRNIMFGIKTMGTGEIKALLTPLLAARANGVPVAAPDPVPATTSTQPRGWLRAFVVEHGDIDKEPYTEEADRLLALAKQRGLKTTRQSITQCMYALRADQAAEREHTKTALARSLRPQAAPAPEPPGPVVAHPPSRAALADDDVELLRMLDETAAKLADVAAAVGLIRETVVRRGEKRRQLKELLQGL